MTICCGCGLDKEIVDGCTIKHVITRKDEKIKRIPFEIDDKSIRCHDCNAVVGKYHHLFCDVERCPECGGQRLWCFCNSYKVEGEK